MTRKAKAKTEGTKAARDEGTGAAAVAATPKTHISARTRAVRKGDGGTGIGQARKTILYATNKAVVQEALDRLNPLDLEMLHECQGEAKGDWRRAKISRCIRDLEAGATPATAAMGQPGALATEAPGARWSPPSALWPAIQTTKRVMLCEIVPIEEDHRPGRVKADVTAMVDSLHSHGLEVPVRLAATADGPYRIIDGETRRQAAVRLGWTDILADVHPAMSDAGMHVLRSVLNLDRLGTTPVDECMAVLSTLRAITGKKEFGQGMTAEASVTVLPPEVAATAAALGRSERWVRDRLVLARLSGPVRDLVAAGRLNLGQAREIAKVANFSTQGDLAERFATDVDGVGQVWGLDDVRAGVEDARRAIRGTRWDPSVAYVGMRSCTECPHNTAAVNRLFADEQSIEEGCCMNAACYQYKTDAAEKDLEKAVKAAVKAKAPGTAAGCRPFVPEGLKAGAVARQVEKQTGTGNGERGTGKGGRGPEPERKQTPEQKLEAAREEWKKRLSNQGVQALRKAFGKDPKKWAAWHLARRLGEIEKLHAYPVRDPKKQADCWRAARAILKPVAEGKADLEALAVKALGEPGGDVFWVVYQWSDVALSEFAGLLGVKAAEPPTLKEFHKSAEPGTRNAEPGKKAKQAEAEVRTCRVCGCTDAKACPDDGTGNPCHWVASDLCSACGTEDGKERVARGKGKKAKAKSRGRRLLEGVRRGKIGEPAVDMNCDHDCETCKVENCESRD